MDHNTIELLRFAVDDLGIDAGAMHYEYDDIIGKVFTKDVLQTIMENNLILGKHTKYQQNLIELAKIIVSSQKVCGLEDRETVEELMTALENRNANDPRLNFEFRMQRNAAITPKENFIGGPISANQVSPENSVNRNVR